jgi:hypothetical protein
MIIQSSAILHGCFGRLGDASTDPDFHSNEWTLVRNKRNKRMKENKDNKISKFNFGTHLFKTAPGTVNFEVTPEGNNLTNPMKNENVAITSDFK